MQTRQSLLQGGDDDALVKLASVMQQHQRTPDPRLTEETYMDEALLLKPIADELKSVPPIPHFAAGESVPTTGEPTISGPVPDPNRAELMQKTGCSTGHFEAHQGNGEVGSTVSGEQQGGEAQVTQLAQDGTKEQGLTPDGIGPSEERVMGLESIRNSANAPENQQTPAAGAAKASVAVCPPVPANPDLRAVVEAWPTLPDAIKAGILAMVRAAGQKPDLR